MSLSYNLMCGKELEDRCVEIGLGSSMLLVSLDRAEFLSVAMCSFSVRFTLQSEVLSIGSNTVKTLW